MKTRIVLLTGVLSLLSGTLRAETLSLVGEWGFTLDLQRRGEASGWPDIKPVEGKKHWTGWDVVTVPHTYSGDRTPRALYTAAAAELTSVVLADGSDRQRLGRRDGNDYLAQEFSRKTLRNHTLRITRPDGGAPETSALPDLAPGESWKQEFARLPKGTSLEVTSPGGLHTAVLQR